MSLNSVIQNRLFAALAVPALIGGMVACDLSTDPQPPGSTLFVLNAAPGFSSAQLRVDQLNVGGPLQFRQFDGGFHIRESEDGPYLFTYRDGTDTVAKASVSLEIPRDSTFLIVMTQRSTGGGLLVLRDDFPTLSATTNALVRVVNTAPATGVAPAFGGPVDVYILTQNTQDIATSNPQIQNLLYEGISPRLEITPGEDSVRVIVTEAGTQNVIVQRKYGVTPYTNGDLFPGSVTSIFLVNHRTSSGVVEQDPVLGM